jgi:sugar phosphate isomerase/epimerase
VKLALNTYVYEVGKFPIEKTLRSAVKFGFKNIEYAAYESGDPTLMSPAQRKDLVARFRGEGLYCAQLLLIHTEEAASPDAAKREETLEYMKRCSDFLLELGGKQALVCWGCGVHRPDVLPEQTWLNAVSTVRKFAEWSLEKGILIDFEIEPHVYFVTNSTAKAAQFVEDVGMPNVFPNVDIGHLCIVREAPCRLDKLRDRILQVHISETNTFEHTNSIIGTGQADFKAYIEKVLELGIEDNCRRYGEPCVAGVEMGSPGIPVDDPDRWVRESLEYLKKILPNVTL